MGNKEVQADVAEANQSVRRVFKSRWKGDLFWIDGNPELEEVLFDSSMSDGEIVVMGEVWKCCNRIRCILGEQQAFVAENNLPAFKRAFTDDCSVALAVLVVRLLERVNECKANHSIVKNAPRFSSLCQLLSFYANGYDEALRCPTDNASIDAVTSRLAEGTAPLLGL